jgi:hypothetical protein
MTLAMTALLVAPMFLHDLSDYPFSAGAASGLIATPLLYAAVLGTAIVISLRLATTNVAWLASATAVALAVPRFFVYDISFVMPAVQPDRGDRP